MPAEKQPSPPPLWHALAALCALLMAAMVYVVFFATPLEEQMGVVQKIFYLHVPSANAMYGGFICAALGGLMYLWKRTDRWDALSVAGAEVGVLFCTIVLVTGPLWGRKAWGVFWVWDPRLTSTLLTGMIYVAFVGLRSFGTPGEVEKRFAAALAVVGFPLLFLIKYSVQRWGGQHPIVISGGGGIDGSMVPALVTGFLAVSALFGWLLWTRFRVERQRQEIERMELELAEAGELEDS